MRQPDDSVVKLKPWIHPASIAAVYDMVASGNGLVGRAGNRGVFGPQDTLRG
jgi:hypothetical protein